MLRETVAAFQRALDITENQYRAGTSSSADYVTALAQLQSTQALLVGVGVQRQTFEHAIAVLTGHAPSDLTIPPWEPRPAWFLWCRRACRSALLERRPDVAAAERQMQQENALIGVQIAAYYPDVSLSALGGFASNTVSMLFNTASSLWSIGASAAETLYSGGARPAAVTAARATYDQFVAGLPTGPS